MPDAQEPVLVKKKVNKAKLAGGLLLMLVVPTTCVVGGVAQNDVSITASFVAFVLGLVLFVVGRMQD